MVAIGELLKNYGCFRQERPPRITCKNAADKIDELLRMLFVDPKLTSESTAYQEVAEWLTDNKHRGLLLYGSCGLGKTVLAGMVLPMLLQSFNYDGGFAVVNCYRANEINQKYKEIRARKFAVIDDIGQETKLKEFGNDLGYVLADIVDNAEREGNLLILTTNLSLEQISEKYGDRTLDRLKAITKTVLFEGESLRK